MMFAIEPIGADPRRLVSGVAATAFYLAHVAHHVRARTPENTLWACHLGALLVGAGLLLASPLSNAIGLLWLIPGVPLWILYLTTGGRFVLTSALTHLGGSALGFYGCTQLGVPEGAWWKAALLFSFLVAVSRQVSSIDENVNFSVKVWTGWERRFPSHRNYVLLMLTAAFAIFFVLEKLLRWWKPL